MTENSGDLSLITASYKSEFMRRCESMRRRHYFINHYNDRAMFDGARSVHCIQKDSFRKIGEFNHKGHLGSQLFAFQSLKNYSCIDIF